MKRSFLAGRRAFAAAVVILVCAGRATAQQSIGNLGLAWWQWATNFSSADNPITQPSGEVDCSYWTAFKRLVPGRDVWWQGKALLHDKVWQISLLSNRQRLVLGTRGLHLAGDAGLH